MVHDDLPQQVFSRVASGQYHKESDVTVLAADLKGVYITEIFTPDHVVEVG